MNFSTSALRGSRTSKENLPSLNKTEAAQVQRSKQRTVLGVLSENEQRGRSFNKVTERNLRDFQFKHRLGSFIVATRFSSQGSQISRHSSVSDSSQLTFHGCTSSSSFDVYVEEAREVVLAASGQEVVSDSYCLEAESDVPQSKDVTFLLELSLSSCHDASMQSESDESLMVKEALCVSEYTNDIHQHLRESEMKFRPVPGCLGRHPEITAGMRLILVDWLVEVVQEYSLRSETLHLAVNYLDRFLSQTSCVKRSKLQLLGTAALLIASKYEEILPPELNDFVYITDNTYTKKQLIQMEHVLLKVLTFQMAAPTINQFLRLFSSVHSVCAKTQNLALYVAELSLLEIEPFMKYTPSMVAAAAYCLATYTVNKSFWPDSLYSLTGYTVDDIVPCVIDLHQLHISAETHPQQTIREKYKSSKYCRVSWIIPPVSLPFSYDSLLHPPLTLLPEQQQQNRHTLTPL